jgi:hypothetical protein
MGEFMPRYMQNKARRAMLGGIISLRQSFELPRTRRDYWDSVLESFQCSNPPNDTWQSPSGVQVGESGRLLLTEVQEYSTNSSNHITLDREDRMSLSSIIELVEDIVEASLVPCAMSTAPRAPFTLSIVTENTFPPMLIQARNNATSIVRRHRVSATNPSSTETQVQSDYVTPTELEDAIHDHVRHSVIYQTRVDAANEVKQRFLEQLEIYMEIATGALLTSVDAHLTADTKDYEDSGARSITLMLRCNQTLQDYPLKPIVVTDYQQCITQQPQYLQNWAVGAVARPDNGGRITYDDTRLSLLLMHFNDTPEAFLDHGWARK